MNKGVVIHLDNDFKGVLEPSKNLFDQQGFDLNYITCTSNEEFKQLTYDHKHLIKALIFDLLSKDPTSEELQHDAEFLEQIRISFAEYNIPIFVYSGFLQALKNEFDNFGTVYKIEKENGIQPVFDKFRQLYESGFVEVFCPGGILNSQIQDDLHKAFTGQFKGNFEIERIINQIKGGSTYEESSPRIKKVFKRIAIRTLLSELLLPEVDENGNLTEETVNTVEHYNRRIGKIKVWTGDIFKKNTSDEFLFILTPRCNVIRNESVLVCPFIWKDIISKNDKISKMLQGDPLISGYDRHIPPSPIFEGGKLALSKYFMVDKTQLLSDYTLYISLSDELTNEIVGKFGAHFFRTGITPWDHNEAVEQIQNDKK